jgi:hypothetical protein
MIVCDACKNTKLVASQCFVTLIKTDESKSRSKEREIRRYPVHLCEGCITRAITKIHRGVASLDEAKADA